MLPELFYKLSNPNITFYDLLPGGPFKSIIIKPGETLIWETRVATAADVFFILITSTFLFYRAHLRFFTMDFFFFTKEPLCFQMNAKAVYVIYLII